MSSSPAPRANASEFLGPVHQHLVTPLLDRWYGRRTRAWTPLVEARTALPAAALRDAHVTALRAFLCKAGRDVPFYRRRFAEAGFDPTRMEDPSELAKVPRLARSEVAGESDALLSDRFRGHRLIEAASGGTTSAPVPFRQTAQAIWRKNAAAVVLRRRMGWPLGVREAYLWGAVGDMAPEADGCGKRWKTKLRRCVDRNLGLQALDLSDARLDHYAERLIAYQPHVLQAYPSATDLLARRVLQTGVHLQIPLVVLSAETVFPAQRARIAAAFGSNVLSFYGAREVGWIAGECPSHHRLHLNTDGIYLEVDEEGRLLVTDLVNDAMPLIRYTVGDRGRLSSEPCPCGDPRPVIAELAGRVNDVFELPSGRRVPGTICDVRNYQLIDGIAETQLIQESLTHLRVRWVANPLYEPHHLDRLREWLDRCFGQELVYEFERVAAIEPEPNGKIRYCISLPGVSV